MYLAVADEENLGTWGAEHLVEHELDAVMADYVVTESGGFQMPTATGPRLPVMVDEKGTYWSKHHGARDAGSRVAAVPHRQRARHRGRGGAPARRRIEPPTHIRDTWRRFVEGVDFGPEWNAALLDEDRLNEFCESLPIGLARLAHACTHTTFAPTIVHGGTKTNVIPDLVDVEVDIRTLPGQRSHRRPQAARRRDRRPRRPGRDHAVRRRTSRPRLRRTRRCGTRWTACRPRLVEGSALVPFLTVGATDNRFFRRAGSVGYGFGLFSRKLSFDDYATMFHGNDERVDIESLVLSTRLWDGLARDLVG